MTEKFHYQNLITKAGKFEEETFLLSQRKAKECFRFLSLNKETQFPRKRKASSFVIFKVRNTNEKLYDIIHNPIELR